MPFSQKLKRLADDLTRSGAPDPDEARVEYALRVNLIQISVITFIFAMLALYAHWRRIILLDTLLIILFLALLAGVTWIFTLRGHWKKTRIVPVAAFFLIAVYGNFVGGIGAPAMLIYVLSIVFAMQLYGRRMQFAVTAASILFYTGIAILHGKGLIPAPRTEAATFQNRVFIAVLTMLTIGVLLRFIISQLEKAVRISRDNAQALAATNEALLASNRELEKSEDNFRTLFDASPIPVILHRRGAILFVNDAYAKMVGVVSKDALLGTDMFDHIAPEERARVAEVVGNRQPRGDFPVSYETTGIRADGRKFHCEVNVAFVALDDGPAALAFLKDITERKTAERDKERMQKQLLQAQKMEAVGTLTGGIAHDFNNMLTGIMGSLNLMDLQLKKEAHPANDSLLKYVAMALESSQRAADMTQQLLAFSRKSELKLRPVDVNLSLRHIQRLCQNSFPKSVALDFRLGQAPLWIHADPTQIQQVLLNLCVNASHAMTTMRTAGARQGGILSVCAEKMTCDEGFLALNPDASSGLAYVAIRVSDTGVGMDEETRRQIFDPFFTTKSKQDGTGLGLAMVYGIVTQHGGFLHVYSAPKKGSVFHVFLPALDAAAPVAKAGAAGPGIIAGNGKILVIDDETSLLGIARAMLERCGYDVITAESGAAGVEIYRQDHGAIQGVLLDLSMPGMSGLEVFKRMKAINPGVKAVLTSGFMEDRDQEKALALEVRSFLPKPYSVEELSVKMKELLDDGYRHNYPEA